MLICLSSLSYRAAAKTGNIRSAYKLKYGLSQALADNGGRGWRHEEAGMAGLTIGVMARQVGVAASTLRYYEKVGLLPAPARVGNRRLYDSRILGRIRIVLLARDAGFSVRETRAFLQGFPPGTTPASRWREMARRKIAELDDLVARVVRMKLYLESSFDCECRTLEDCERYVAKMKPMQRLG
jgi:MerR family redox-sensitive transcriptional activator SoxR